MSHETSKYLKLMVFALQWKIQLCIPFLGIARPQSQFPHSCVCERFFYIPRIGSHISCSRIGGSKNGGIYIYLTDTWMWKLGLWPRNSFSGNIYFKFSVMVFCSLYWTHEEGIGRVGGSIPPLSPFLSEQIWPPHRVKKLRERGAGARLWYSPSTIIWEENVPASSSKDRSA